VRGAVLEIEEHDLGQIDDAVDRQVVAALVVEVGDRGLAVRRQRDRIHEARDVRRGVDLGRGDEVEPVAVLEVLRGAVVHELDFLVGLGRADGPLREREQPGAARCGEEPRRLGVVIELTRTASLSGAAYASACACGSAAKTPRRRSAPLRSHNGPSIDSPPAGQWPNGSHPRSTSGISHIGASSFAGL
jgi:hypothetical protein